MNSGLRLNAYGAKGIVRDLLIPFAQLLLVLIAAGTFYWKNAWLYIGLNFICHAVQTIILIERSPDLLNERGHIKKETTKRFDKLFYVIASPLFFSISIFNVWIKLIIGM